MRTASKMAVAITTIALAVGLSACSGGQSTADACKIINTEARQIATDANGAMSSIGSDPTAAVNALKKASADLKKVGDKVTNAEVKTAWNGFTKAYDNIATVVDDAASAIKDDPSKASGVMSKLTDASTKIQDAGKALDKVCS